MSKQYPLLQAPAGLALRPISLALMSSLFLAACGSGSTDSPVNAVAASATPGLTVSGTLVDGYLRGALVFLDLNSNQVRDIGEPISEPTDARGAFTIRVDGLTQAQLAGAHFVSEVPDTAYDADDLGKTLKDAGKQAYTLVAPASAFLRSPGGQPELIERPLVSPLTTLISHEMRDNGMTLAQAKQEVQKTLGLAGKNLTGDFVATGDAELGRIARAMAISLGEAGRAVAAAASTGSATADERSLSPREAATVAVGIVKRQMPTLIASLSLNHPTASAVPVAVVSMALAQPDLQRVLTESVKDIVPAKAQTAQYVVVFHQNVNDPAGSAGDIARTHGGQMRFTYTRALKGFALNLPAAASQAFLDAMQRNPLVDYVEQDRAVSFQQTVTTSATWGLDRSDQRDLPLDNSYTYTANATGVNAYVIDTGILASHLDFGGRVGAGFTAIADGNGSVDCNGHGTHVSGTIGGTTWGVAKAVNLVPVRVLDCTGSGSTSGVIAGIDWMLANLRLPAVANMSLGGAASTSLDAAVAKAVASGVTMVVAAGNSNVNACDASPAREPSAITVGATTNTDTRASYSNYGTCLDLFAPGSGITSTWFTSTTSTAVLSGTSMAAPHVSGLAALYLQTNPSATPSVVAASIKSSATADKVTDAGAGSVNLLMFANPNGYAPVSSTPPAASISVSVASLTGSATASRSGWRALVTASVKKADGTLMAGAVVTGGFTAGGSALSCTTMSNGSCTMVSGNIGSKTTSTTFSVSGITGTNLSYSPSANAASALTVNKP